MEEYHVSFVLLTCGKGIRKDWIVPAANAEDAKFQVASHYCLDEQEIYIVSAEPYRKEPLLNKR
jgi:hypothetical protein